MIVSKDLNVNQNQQRLYKELNPNRLIQVRASSKCELSNDQ